MNDSRKTVSVPRSIEIERGVLGSILIDADLIPQVREILSPEDFFRSEHGSLYQKIVEIFDAGKLPDAIILNDSCSVDPRFESIDVETTVADCLMSVNHARNGMYYARIIREKSDRRKISITLQQMLDSIDAETETLDEFSARYDSSISEIFQSTRAKESSVVQISTVQIEELEWLWPGRIPLRKITLLAGDPGLGKSFLSLGLAATVSRGALWPDKNTILDLGHDPRAPIGSTLLLSAEDGLADTIRPRLEKAGANLGHIYALTMIKDKRGNQRMFNFKADLRLLEQTIETIGDCRLVIVDPITSYLGESDDHKNGEIRGILGPLSDLASRYNVALVLITHLNKGNGNKSIYRAMGSLAFVAAARTAWIVIKDKHDPKRRLFLNSKCNIAEEPSGLAYRLIDGALQWEDGVVEITADEALELESEPKMGSGSGEKKQGRPSLGKVDEAIDWIEVELASRGSRPQPELQNLALSASISKGSFYRALQDPRFEVYENGGFRFVRLRAPSEPIPEF